MKKVNYFFILLVSAMMMCVGCNKEPQTVQKGKSEVMINLGIPSGIGAVTKATDYVNSAKGGLTNLGAENVKWDVAIYHELDSTTPVFSDNTATGASYSANVTLVMGEKYVIEARADFASPGEFNDESEDFYVLTQEFTANTTPVTGVLKRIYGKLRLVAEDYGVMNAQTGKTITKVAVTYAAGVPVEAEFNNYSSETAGEKTIFVDYLEAPTDGSAAYYPFKVLITFNDGTKEVVVDQDIPVKENCLTTVRGNIFTGDVKLSLTIDENFDDPEDVVLYGYTPVANTAELKAALAAGEDKIVLERGTFDLGGATAAAANVIIKGVDKDACIINMASSVYPENKAISFENLTYNTQGGLAYNESTFGFIHRAAQVNVKDCNIKGGLRLNVQKANIDNCQFVMETESGFDGYALFYYGADASKVVVTNSTFNTKGKGIVIYSEGAKTYDLTVEKCTFNSDNASADKTAVQMHTEKGISGVVRINNTTATGFLNVNNGLWRDINNTTKVETNQFDIYVDGVKVHSKN